MADKEKLIEFRESLERGTISAVAEEYHVSLQAVSQGIEDGNGNYIKSASIVSKRIAKEKAKIDKLIKS